LGDRSALTVDWYGFSRLGAAEKSEVKIVASTLQLSYRGLVNRLDYYMQMLVQAADSVMLLRFSNSAGQATASRLDGKTSILREK
jgi:hypothetical protein